MKNMNIKMTIALIPLILFLPACGKKDTAIKTTTSEGRVLPAPEVKTEAKTAPDPILEAQKRASIKVEVPGPPAPKIDSQEILGAVRGLQKSLEADRAERADLADMDQQLGRAQKSASQAVAVAEEAVAVAKGANSSWLPSLVPILFCLVLTAGSFELFSRTRAMHASIGEEVVRRAVPRGEVSAREEAPAPVA